MVSLAKGASLEVRYRFPDSTKWHIDRIKGKKSPSGIAAIYTELWDSLPELSNPDIDVIQPNWAGTGEAVTLSQYRPFQSIYTNWDHLTI